MTIGVAYAPSFVRQFQNLDTDLQEEAREKILLFANKAHHATLRVHKLHGSLSGKWSFSVNYRYRIVFIWENKKSAILLAIGDHAIYEK